MPNDTDKDTSTESLTEARIHELINAALLGSSKRTEKRFAEMLEQSLAGFKDKTETKVEVQSDKVAPSAEVAALQKQIEKMQKEREAEKLSLAAQSKSVREKEAYGQLKSLLTGKVKPEAIEHVAKLIFHADKRVAVNDEGQMTYRTDDDSEIDINEGVKQYLKSKDASIFLPAPVSKAAPAKPAFGGLQLPNRSTSEEVKPSASQASDLLKKLGLSVK